eukprot:g65028.t1
MGVDLSSNPSMPQSPNPSSLRPGPPPPGGPPPSSTSSLPPGPGPDAFSQPPGLRISIRILIDNILTTHNPLRMVLLPSPPPPSHGPPYPTYHYGALPGGPPGVPPGGTPPAPSPSVSRHHPYYPPPPQPTAYVPPAVSVPGLVPYSALVEMHTTAERHSRSAEQSAERASILTKYSGCFPR